MAYFVLASAWIVGADLLLTTSLLLFFVLRRASDGWRVAEERRGMVIEHARERFRTLCSHVQELREVDRIRIAREIHDELGQLVTGIKMEVRLLENQLADHDDRSLNPAIDKLVEISELVDDTIASVQNIASSLRPSALDNQGLGTALIDEAGQFSQRSGIPCSIVVENSPDCLHPETRTAVFRIFQEALTNVARHANARRIDSKLSVEGNLLKLTIHDDGRGIDPAILDNPKSLGLIGMLERAESVGGWVTIKPHPQLGTEVVLTVPLSTLENHPKLRP